MSIRVKESKGLVSSVRKFHIMFFLVKNNVRYFYGGSHLKIKGDWVFKPLLSVSGHGKRVDDGFGIWSTLD